MNYNDSIDYLNRMIYIKHGERKALTIADKRSILKNNYNKGYLAATSNDLKFLSELREILISEQHEILESCKKMVG